jgi:hypothetical protein
LGSETPPIRYDSSKYPGVAERNLLPAVTLSTPSTVSASPNVSSTDIDADAPRMRTTSPL